MSECVLSVGTLFNYIVLCVVCCVLCVVLCCVLLVYSAVQWRSRHRHGREELCGHLQVRESE